MIREESVYRIGVIGKPHGVKGEVSMSFTDDAFDRVDADHLVLKIEGIFVPFFMEEYRFKSNETALIKFETIDSQERAKELTGCEVFFPRELVQELTDELSWAQIIGFQLVDAQTCNAIGTIVDVDETTINTLFVVEDQQNNELLIPASEEFIKEVDVDKKTIKVTLPQGILDLE